MKLQALRICKKFYSICKRISKIELIDLILFLAVPTALILPKVFLNKEAFEVFNICQIAILALLIALVALEIQRTKKELEKNKVFSFVLVMSYFFYTYIKSFAQMFENTIIFELCNLLIILSFGLCLFFYEYLTN